MKKTIPVIILTFTLSSLVMAQQPAPPVKLPEKQSAEIKDVLARQAELERQYRELNLLRENLLLNAALELGLTKEKLRGCNSHSMRRAILYLCRSPLIKSRAIVLTQSKRNSAHYRVTLGEIIVFARSFRTGRERAPFLCSNRSSPRK